MTDSGHCFWFRDHLDEFVAEEADERQSEEVRRHLGSCDSCRRLAGLIRDAGENESEFSCDGLTESILRQTSGSACGRVAELLTEQLDGPLPHGDLDLLEMHLSHCSQCRMLAVTLKWMITDLRTMTSVEPDDWFATDVIRHTRRIPQRRSGPVVWLKEWWTERRRSPLFELQTAYAGALMITLTLGVPNTWFNVKYDIAAEFRERVENAAQQVVDPLDNAASWAVTQGKQAWEMSGGQFTPRLREKTHRLEGLIDNGTRCLHSAADHAGTAARAAWNRRFLEATLNVECIGQDFRDLLAVLKGSRSENTEEYDSMEKREDKSWDFPKIQTEST